MKQTVVFDFDGVIHSYTSGWKGEAIIPDEPVPRMREVIAELRQSYRIVVQSSRCLTSTGRDAVSAYLTKHDIIVDDVTAEKVPAVVYVDDRALLFDGDASTLPEKIRAFRPWHKRHKS